MAWFLRFFFLIAYSLNLVWSLSVAELSILESTIGANSCEFYTTLESMIPCGKNGYASDFALKYCKAYLAARDDFIDKKWQDGVRVCLQRTMLSKLQASANESCSKISDWGFDSHFDCYMRPIPSSPEVNFCGLKSKDVAKIGWIARGKVFQGQVMKQFAKLVTRCVG